MIGSFETDEGASQKRRQETQQQFVVLHALSFFGTERHPTADQTCADCVVAMAAAALIFERPGALKSLHEIRYTCPAPHRRRFDVGNTRAISQIGNGSAPDAPL